MSLQRCERPNFPNSAFQKVQLPSPHILTGQINEGSKNRTEIRMDCSFECLLQKRPIKKSRNSCSPTAHGCRICPWLDERILKVFLSSSSPPFQFLLPPILPKVRISSSHDDFPNLPDSILKFRHLIIVLNLCDQYHSHFGHFLVQFQPRQRYLSVCTRYF